MKRKIFIPFIAGMVLLSSVALSSCDDLGLTNSGGSNSGSSTPASVELSVPDPSEMFTDGDKDLTYKESSATKVTLSGSSATFKGKGVSVSGNTVTLSSEETYIFTGSMNGSIIIEAQKTEKVRLIFRDASVTSSDYAALYVKSADKVFITLEGNNSLISSGEFTQRDENNVDGALFSKEDLTIKGSGSLQVNCAQGHGIVCKDDFKVTGGSINIDATGHAVQANDSARIADGSFVLKAGKDGIHVENAEDATLGYVYIEKGSFEITSATDGISASGTLHVAGGEFNIKSGGGSTATLSADLSAKGLKSNGNLVVVGGTVAVDSADDSVHSNASVQIGGGTLTLTSGDDGVHADAALLVTGGDIEVVKSYEGLEGKNITVEGGVTKITARDDGLNAAGGNDGSSVGGRPGQNQFASDPEAFIKITDGELYINASGDGVDSNGTLSVSGGYTVVEGPTDNGNGPLDYGDGSTADITGGTFVAIGASGMAENFTSATQGAVLWQLNSSQRAGTAISLTDADGNVLFEMTSTKQFASIVISTPDLLQNETYTLTAGTLTQSVTIPANYVYGSGTGGGMGGNQGGMGGPGGRW